MSRYSHFTTKERESLLVYVREGKKNAKIARLMGRSPSTISKELRLLRSLPSESAHPVTASKNLQFLIATTGKICYDESTNSSINLNLTKRNKI